MGRCWKEGPTRTVSPLIPAFSPLRGEGERGPGRSEATATVCGYLDCYGLAARDDFDDFEAIAGLQLARSEFGRGNGVAVVLYHDASRKQLLSNEKLFDAAG